MVSVIFRFMEIIVQHTNVSSLKDEQSTMTSTFVVERKTCSAA